MTALFIVSLLLAVGPAVFLAWTVSWCREVRFWVVAVGVVLQLSTCAHTLSCFRLLTPAGWIIAQLLLAVGTTAGAFLLRHCKAGSPESLSLSLPEEAPSSLVVGTRALLVAALAAFVLVSLNRVIREPIDGFDELMYHGSKVAHALQERTLFFDRTHNERQVSLTFGSEVLLLWPLLLTRNETIARLVFWCGLPLALFGFLFLLRRLLAKAEKAPATTAILVAMLAWISTPLVFLFSMTQKPEIWLCFWTIGAGWALLVGITQKRSAILALAGACAAMAAQTRQFSILLVFGLVAAVIFGLGIRNRQTWRGLGALIIMATVVLALSGFFTLVGRNLSVRGGLFASPEMTHALSAPKPFLSFPVHLARFQIDLIELPSLPRGSGWATKQVTRLATAMGVRNRLPGEVDPWPGQYSPHVPSRAFRLGLFGLLVSPILLWLLVRACRERFAGGRQLQPDTRRALALLFPALAMTFGLLFVLLWQGYMFRFFLSPYSLMVPLGALCLSTRPALCGLMGVLFFGQAGLVLGDVLAGRTELPLRPGQGTRMKELERVLPTDARLVLIAAQDCLDYDLYSPATGLSRRITLWGDTPATPGSLQRLTAEQLSEFIVFERETPLSRHWRASFDPQPLLALVRQSGAWEEVRLSPSCPQRLFRRRTTGN